MKMKFTSTALLAALLGTTTQVQAFAPPSVLLGSSGKACGCLFADATSTVGKTILQELNDLDSELGDSDGRDDTPANRDQLSKLIGIMERVVEVEKKATSGVDLFNAFVAGESDKMHSPSEITLENEATTRTPKTLGIVDSIFARKPTLDDLLEETGTDMPDTHQKSFVEAGMDILKTILEMQSDGPLGFDQYPTHPEYKDVSLADMPKMRGNGIEQPPPFEYCYSVSRNLATLKRALRIIAGMKMNEPKVLKAKSAQERFEAWFSDAKILGFLPNPFNLVPRPNRLIRDYMKDTEFGRQYLAGSNPNEIRVCSNPKTQLPKALNNFFAVQNIDVAKMAAEKRLFYVDYHELAPLKHNPHNAYPVELNPDIPISQENFRYFEAPIAVFELDPNRKDMEVIAIQLKREDHSEVYSAKTSSEATWFMAKTVTANAEVFVHQFLDHFSESHIFFEAMVVAVHNTIRQRGHRLWDFFKVISKDTLFMNWTARQNLVTYSPRAFTDEVVGAGTGQLMQIIQNRWKKYDFFEHTSFPNQLKNRGFDKDFDIPGYLYRTDGLKLWEAMGEFATNFVDEIYVSDKEVADDFVLKEWAAAMVDPAMANVRGFPEHIKDKATLALIIQCMWFMCSVHHSVTNFSQFDYMCFAPNRPFCLRMSMEDFKKKGDDTLEYIFENVMPTPAIQATTMVATRVLTTPTDAPINGLEGHFKKTKYGNKSYKIFLKRLKVIGDEIEARNKKNKKAGNAVFAYMHPSVVASSIDG